MNINLAAVHSGVVIRVRREGGKCVCVGRGGGGVERRRKHSPFFFKDKGGVGKKEVGEKKISPSGFIFWGQWGRGISISLPLPCLLQMPIIDLSELDGISLAKNMILFHECPFCKNVSHITVTQSVMLY